MATNQKPCRFSVRMELTPKQQEILKAHTSRKGQTIAGFSTIAVLEKLKAETDEKYQAALEKAVKDTATRA